MHGQPLVHADETYPLALRSKAPYSRSKAMAEQVVLEESRGALEAVIVRPRFVWGRGDTTLLPLLVEGTRSGAFRWVGGGRHRTSTTHVDNTVEGLLCAAEHGRGGRAYFVTDGNPVRFRDFVGDLIATQGVTPPTASVPAPVARALAATAETAWKLLPLPGAPPLTRFAAWVASQECTLDDTRARSELGYAPVDDARAGHARAARRGLVLGRRREPPGQLVGEVLVLVEADLRLEQQRQLEHRRAGLLAQPPDVRLLQPRALVLGERGADRGERLGLEPVLGGAAEHRRPRPSCSARGRGR